MERTREFKRFVSVGVLSALLSFAIVYLTPFYWLGLTITDRLLGWVQIPRHPDLVLIVIDDESLQKLGRFPFDRIVYAQLLDRLKQARAKVAVFDVMFIEPTPSDKAFAEAIRRFGKVILSANLTTKETSLPKRFRLSVKLQPPIRINGVILPPEPLLSACSGLGFVYPFPDQDYVCRTLPLAVGLDKSQEVFPSLSLAAAIAWLGEPKLRPNAIQWHDRVIKLGSDWDIPVLPPFSPERIGFPSLSLAKVLEGEFDLKMVEGKLVLVGMASGWVDRFQTPTDPMAYGVEIHAAAINSLLTGKALTYAPLWLQFIIALALSISASLSVLFLKFQRSLLVFAAMLFVTYAFVVLSIQRGLILPPITFFLSATISFIAAVGLLLEMYWDALQRIKAYVAQPVMDTVALSPERFRVGERREITVLFSDIRNFTPIAASLHPYRVVTLLESYFNSMTEIVRLYGGVVDKFLGDGMMVLFGLAPNQDDHALRAVLCALHMLEELDTVNWEWERVTGSKLRIGIGINTGVAIVGEIGAEWRKELTALGAAVNLAQRLEQLTKEVGATLLISDSTYQHVVDLVVAEPLEPLTVKGFEQPISVYSVTGLTEIGRHVRRSILEAKT